MRRAHDPVEHVPSAIRPRASASASAPLWCRTSRLLGITDCYASPLLEAASWQRRTATTSRITRRSIPRLAPSSDFIAFASALAGRRHGAAARLRAESHGPRRAGESPGGETCWSTVQTRRLPRIFDIDWAPVARITRVAGCCCRSWRIATATSSSRGEIRARDEDGVPGGDRLLRSTVSRIADQARSDRCSAAPSSVVRTLNGIPGEPHSWDRLHDLLERQWYRLAHWKTSLDEINYRRFFDVNHLGGSGWSCRGLRGHASEGLRADRRRPRHRSAARSSRRSARPGGVLSAPAAALDAIPYRTARRRRRLLSRRRREDSGAGELLPSRMADRRNDRVMDS